MNATAIIDATMSIIFLTLCIPIVFAYSIYYTGHHIKRKLKGE